MMTGDWLLRTNTQSFRSMRCLFVLSRQSPVDSRQRRLCRIYFSKTIRRELQVKINVSARRRLRKSLRDSDSPYQIGETRVRAQTFK
jgi:hypothetical protein